METDQSQVKQDWYAVKVFYNKVFRMEDTLSGMGLESYLAIRKLQLKGAAHMAAARALAQVDAYHRKDCRYIQEGPVIYERVPLVNSLIFVKASEEEIKAVDRRLRTDAPGDRPLGFVYKTSDFKSFAVIPTAQMTSFRLVTEAGLSGLEFYSADDISRFRLGDHVRVTEGPLKGAEGYIRRIKKNKRLLVCIEGVIAVATSYLPPKMLEKLS